MPFIPRLLRGTIIGLLCLTLLSVPYQSVHAADPNPTAKFDDPAALDQDQELTAQTGCARSNYEPINTAFEQEVVVLVNQERADNGLAPLKLNTDLSYAARFHARDLLVDDYFEHDSYDRQNGNLVKVCDWNTRIENYYSNRYWLGENIAAGQRTPEEAMQSWMNSEGHRANILRPEFREMGVGYFDGGGKYYAYWDQDFGSRSSVYPLIINSEAASTDNTAVQLYIYGQGTWDEMRLRNDNDAWGPWQSFQSNVSWQLDWTAGTRTVSVELRKSGQATGASASDSINLTTNGSTLQVTPTTLNFIYNQAEGKMYPSAAVTISPVNANGGTTLSWQASKTASWIDLSRSSGQTPNDSIQVSPDASITNSVGSYDGTITITVIAPANTQGSPKTVNVHISVVKDMPYSIFMPSITH